MTDDYVVFEDVVLNSGPRMGDGGSKVRWRVRGITKDYSFIISAYATSAFNAEFGEWDFGVSGISDGYKLSFNRERLAKVFAYVYRNHFHNFKTEINDGQIKLGSDWVQAIFINASN